MKKGKGKLKTLAEIEKEQEKDWKYLKLWGIVIIFAIIILLSFLLSTATSCTRPVNAAEYPYVAKEDTTQLRAIIRAYNHLLHRVWIDKPNYCEDALCETPEFQELNDLMFSQWEDTFSFYDTQDSIEYYRNWKSGDGRFDYED